MNLLATMTVPVELVRCIRAKAFQYEQAVPRSNLEVKSADELARLVAQLPEPPKPDVLEECAKAFHHSLGFGIAAVQPHEWKPGLRAAIRRYRELLELQADPELEDT